MFEAWTNDVERVALATILRGIRVLGLTSPLPGAGVSTFAAALAEIATRADRKTLLVDLTADTCEGASPWLTGEGSPDPDITRDPKGFDRLTARFDRHSRFRLNDTDLLRRCLTDSLAGYDTLVVDLPPVLITDPGRINAAAAAATCDGVILVCLSGQVTRTHCLQARALLDGMNVPMAGTVLNNLHNPTLGAELAREARRLERRAPGLSRWLQRKALGIALLNHR